MLKGQLSRVHTLARELLDAIHFPACSSVASAAPQMFTLTPAIDLGGLCSNIRPLCYAPMLPTTSRYTLDWVLL